jgi:SAM-dependent methyltransferase
LCGLHDFDDPDVLAAISSLVPERDPLAHVERKVWEFAMVQLFLEDAGRLHESTEVLSVGAGNERILYWLADRVGRVVATDIYGHGAFAGREAQPSMLEDPRAHAPWPYREDHLEVRWMDGRELEFDDASFDAVFTVSSIEHFGGPRDVARAAAEIGRVLRPGGHAIVITECLVRRHPLNAAPVDAALRAATLGRKRREATFRRRGPLGEAFTPRELRTRIVEPSGLRLMQPLDLRLSPESWATVDNATYPLILVRISRSVFTSVCLVMEKPEAAR